MYTQRDSFRTFAPASWAEKFGAGVVLHFAEYGHWLPAEAPAPFAARLGDLWA